MGTMGGVYRTAYKKRRSGWTAHDTRLNQQNQIGALRSEFSKNTQRNAPIRSTK